MGRVMRAYKKGGGGVTWEVKIKTNGLSGEDLLLAEAWNVGREMENMMKESGLDERTICKRLCAWGVIGHIGQYDLEELTYLAHWDG